MFLLCAGAQSSLRAKAKQSIGQQRKYGLLRRFAPRNDGKNGELVVSSAPFPPMLFQFATPVWSRFKLWNESGTNRARIADSCWLLIRSPQHLALRPICATRSSLARLDKRRFGGEFGKRHWPHEANQKRGRVKQRVGPPRTSPPPPPLPRPHPHPPPPAGEGEESSAPPTTPPPPPLSPPPPPPPPPPPQAAAHKAPAPAPPPPPRAPPPPPPPPP